MRIREMKVDNIVIGSGVAGFQSALRLKQFGLDVALVTENIKAGTSRNTGSDKQTYYKLSIAGNDSDSVKMMADDLFSGQCVDGDQAYCEASLSTRSFFRLVELGVPFPCNQYDEYMGYKTDHDKRKRATSAGPYTSKLMTEVLEKEIVNENVKVMDKIQAIRILTSENTVKGLLCLDKNAIENPFFIIWCENIILATGGPAGMYHDSVYPVSQLGSSGLAFDAGAKGKNLTEWQFGIASVHPRWNMSGTYMQALPRVISTDLNGNDEREFLLDYFETTSEMLSMIFLKGYQWPFDVSKIFGGSSLIDLIVYQESIIKERRVYLDFSNNTTAYRDNIPFEMMSEEAYRYLKSAGACFGTPIQRLKKMNQPAVDFFMDHSIDLEKEKVEIKISVQHNNGGISTDSNWESNVHGLFVVGEASGTHGVSRPGGTALNSGQVGAVRASECIAIRKKDNIKNSSRSEDCTNDCYKQAREYIALYENAHGSNPVGKTFVNISKQMSRVGGMIREKKSIEKFLEDTKYKIDNFTTFIERPQLQHAGLLYHLYDSLNCQYIYLYAMVSYINRDFGSRGSALYTNLKGRKPLDTLPDLFRCKLDHGVHGKIVQEVEFQRSGNCNEYVREVRDIPKVDDFFENQWKLYRERWK